MTIETWDEQRFRERLAEMRGEEWTEAACETLGIDCEDTPDAEGDYSCDEALEAIDEALEGFVVPDGLLETPEEGAALVTGNIDCICCDARLNGFVGSLTWGIVNGEGKCDRCGWPYRVYHRPTLDGEVFANISLMLAVHPEAVELNDAKP